MMPSSGLLTIYDYILRMSCMIAANKNHTYDHIACSCTFHALWTPTWRSEPRPALIERPDQDFRQREARNLPRLTGPTFRHTLYPCGQSYLSHGNYSGNEKRRTLAQMAPQAELNMKLQPFHRSNSHHMLGLHG